MDYAVFYRRAIAATNLAREIGGFDVFASAFNSSDRVRIVFDEVQAAKRIWLIHPEYQFTPEEEPTGHVIAKPPALDEVTQIDTLLNAIGPLGGKSLCVDITGFMRNSLSLLAPKLFHRGVRQFTALYSEPTSYRDQEATRFSTTTSGHVRPVRGMYGSPGNGKDHLLVAIGYDHQLVGQVAAYKDGVTAHPLFAFPSLSADMYQQSALRASKSGDIVLRTEWVSNRLFAPANDPFATASVIADRINAIDRAGTAENVYLAPLSTKAQTLGISLYWHLEGQIRGRCSVLLPECLTYSRETSTGLKRLWKYDVELDR